ncbi:MAG: hypothetical protein VKM97_07750, partial [Cyanobacteriota bacterium]|nr:hypothetical protein [Cyanobacteriota bacterium]
MEEDVVAVAEAAARGVAGLGTVADAAGVSAGSGERRAGAAGLALSAVEPMLALVAVAGALRVTEATPSVLERRLLLGDGAVLAAEEGRLDRG